MAKLIKASIIAGILMHVWVTVSWMVLPLHKMTIKSFKDDPQIQLEILKNISSNKKAIYALPAMHSGKAGPGPSAFIALSPKGQKFSWTKIAFDIFNNTITAFLVGFLLMFSGIQGFKNKVFFTTIIALIVASMSTLPMINWWGFALGYAAVEILDLAIISLILGFVLAKFTKN
jgi:hypothetical protein